MLGLRVERGVIEDSQNGWEDVVWIDIDGKRLARVDGDEYVGEPPVELLRKTHFTNPTTDAHEVVLGRCTCGEASCGCVVARVYRLTADTIVWDLFDAGNPPPIALALPRPAADAVFFDAAQYEAAIRSASTDS